MKKVLIASAISIIFSIGSTQVYAEEMPAIAKKSGCSACHAIDKKIVGPSWLDVAKQYGKGDRDMLIEKVKKGGKGNWTSVTGGMPMPPYSPRVNDKTIGDLVDFILTLDH